MRIRATGHPQTINLAQVQDLGRLFWAGSPGVGVVVGIVGFHPINPQSTGRRDQFTRRFFCSVPGGPILLIPQQFELR